MKNLGGMQSVRLSTGEVQYRLSGRESDPCLVIETAMGAACAEWWHLADEWSAAFRVLIYDRVGYGKSGKAKNGRTPDDVAGELNELMTLLGISEAILVGHSMGGLYAYRFAVMFPEKVQALVLVDPVSPDNGRFRTELTRDEFAKSGVDKSINLKLGRIVCSLGLGRLLRPMLRKAPPFYYYDRFSREAAEHILQNSTSGKMYGAALKEYAFLEDDEGMAALKIVPGAIRVPLYLVCHTPDVMEEEIVRYGGADAETAAKIERLWQEIMREYLAASPDSHFVQARGSGHSIHLTDPAVIRDALSRIRAVG
jgi:pimeloyl-ACP methyl ester carboxylesterase